MAKHQISLFSMANSFLLNKSLIWNLTKREIFSRYKGSFFGLFWSIFNPVFMLGVYTFVFSVVFKGRWGQGSDSKSEFALILFAGLIVFNLFSECFNKAPVIITDNVNYVKKIVFPLEVMSFVNVGTAIFHAFMSSVVWLVFYTVLIGMPHLTILFFPAIILPLVFISLGISWLLMSVGVYIRDLTQVVGIATTILMFLSPIFYPMDALPKEYQSLLSLNPLAPSISSIRDIFYWGVVPDVSSYFIYLCCSFFIAYIGYVWFQKTRKGFSDVL